VKEWNMKNKFLEQAKHEYSPKQRLIFLLPLAPIFLFLLPYLFIRLGSGIDHWLQWPQILPLPYNFILGGLLILPGGVFAMWSIYSQFTLGRGTPVPLVATQQLIIQPPYTYCRNPMALGTILVYLGAAVLFHSLGGIVIVLLFSGLLLFYIKRVEEKEMVLRFGQPYLAYKKSTPFIIPRFASGPRQNHPE